MTHTGWLTRSGYLTVLEELADLWTAGETPRSLAGAVVAEETGLINTHTV